MIDEPHGGQAQQLGPSLDTHDLLESLQKMRSLLEEHDLGPLSEAVRVSLMALELVVRDLDSAFVSLNDAADAMVLVSARFEAVERRVERLEKVEKYRERAIA